MRELLENAVNQLRQSKEWASLTKNPDRGLERNRWLRQLKPLGTFSTAAYMPSVCRSLYHPVDAR